MRMIAVNVALLTCSFALRAATEPSVIRVGARYPGANVQVIDATVALPLVEQIQGVEGATRIEAESTKDGTCTISVWLDAKADPARIRDLVQKRVLLVVPALPEISSRKGISIRTEPAQPVEFWFALSTSDDPGNARSLANYARREYTDILRRIPGVSDVRILGTADYLLRITLDTEKLKTHAVSVEEVRAVASAMGDVSVIGAVAPTKATIRLQLRCSGRLSKIDAFGEAVIKTGENGRKVLLGDMGDVELVSMMSNELTTFNGKPAALLAVIAARGTSLKPIERAFELLRKKSPAGMQLTTVVAPDTPRVLRLEMQVSSGSTMEYTQARSERLMKIVRDWNGGLPAISFTDRMQTNRAEFLLTYKPDADAAVLKKRLGSEAPEASIRMSDVTGGKPAFPVRMALTGPDSEKLRKWSEAIVRRARTDALASDVADWPDRDHPHRELIIDSDKVRELGIDLPNALESLSKNQTLKGEKIKDLNDLFVKNAKGEKVPFSAFIAVKDAVDYAPIYRVGSERAIRITANTVAGKSVADCAEKLRALAATEKLNLKLPASYRIVDLVP